MPDVQWQRHPANQLLINIKRFMNCGAVSPLFYLFSFDKDITELYAGKSLYVGIYVVFFFMIYGEWLYVRTEGGHVGHEPVRSRSFRGKEFLMVGLERKEIILGMFFVFFLIFYF